MLTKEMAFFNACCDGNLDEVKKYLDLKLDFNYINPEPATKGHPTAFAIACKNKHLAIVKILLKKIEINVNPIIESDNTPFSKACFDGDMDLIILLLTSDRIEINHRNNLGCTALYMACFNGNVALVRLLLSLDKIDINIRTNKLRSPLYAACENKHEGVVALLLEKDNKIDVNASILDGRTPLHVACQRNLITITMLLLANNNIDLTRQNDSGETALYGAFIRKRKNLVEAILLKVFSQKPMFIFEKISVPMLVELLNPFGFSNANTKIVQDEEGNISIFDEKPLNKKESLIEIIKEVQEKLYLQFSAGYLFMIIVFLCDGYLGETLDSVEKSTGDNNVSRFFYMAQKIPMELQMVLCQRAFGSRKDNVPKLHVEYFAGAIFKKYIPTKEHMQNRATLTALICEAAILCKQSLEKNTTSNRFVAYMTATSKKTLAKYDEIIMYAKQLLENSSFCKDHRPDVESFNKLLTDFIKSLRKVLKHVNPIESKLVALYDNNPELFADIKNNTGEKNSMGKLENIIIILKGNFDYEQERHMASLIAKFQSLQTA